MTPTIVLSECILQRRYLFFANLGFDNIMSIKMKVSYMKINNKQYQYSQQYFNYIVVACFIRGGNRITRENNPICRKPLVNYINYVLSSTPHYHQDSNSQR